jgi:hypothetical protein
MRRRDAHAELTEWSSEEIRDAMNHALGYVEDGIAYDADLDFVVACKAELARRHAPA